MAAGAAPREFHPSGGLPEPYSLPATPHRLKTAARSDCDCKGVPLFLLCVLARKLPRLLHGEGVGRSFVTVVPSCGLETKVVAHPPYGSAQKGCIRLPYTAPELSAGLSLSSCKGRE